jgi:hypothetical protein
MKEVLRETFRNDRNVSFFIILKVLRSEVEEVLRETIPNKCILHISKGPLTLFLACNMHVLSDLS